MEKLAPLAEAPRSLTRYRKIPASSSVVTNRRVGWDFRITSASTFVMPVVEIDGTSLGDGTPGHVSKRLREIYLEESLKAAI